MRLALALGVALAALTATASAQQEEHRVIIRHGVFERDANDDGWVTREEALAAADRMFEELDDNDDGQLNETDRENMERRHRAGHGGHARMLHGDDCTREEEGEGDNRRVTVTCHSDANHEHGEDDGERRVERTATIVRHGGDGHGMTPPVPPVPPVPPIPPLPAVFMVDGIEEFDRNGDQALSREEFRAQHMAFFDASDGNDDGRVRAHRPPEPPEPPTPPTPPEPPRRR